MSTVIKHLLAKIQTRKTGFVGSWKPDFYFVETQGYPVLWVR